MSTLTATVRSLDGHIALGQQEAGHTLVLDRPTATGGTELGFNGGHLLLLGWGGCFKSNLVAAAEGREVKLKRFTIELVGEFENRPNRFKRLVMQVEFDREGDVEPGHLARIAAKSCAVSNTLASSTADVEIWVADERVL